MLMLKIIFLKKNYIDLFLRKNYFKSLIYHNSKYTFNHVVYMYHEPIVKPRTAQLWMD